MLEHFFILAATKIDTKDVPGIPTGDADFVIQGFLNTIYYVAGITAVIIIIFGGIFYAISNGDSTKVKYAKDSIMYAVVGLVVVMSAFVLTNFVIGNF